MSEPSIEFQDHAGKCWWHGHDADWGRGDLACHRCHQPLSYEDIGWLGVRGWASYAWMRLRRYGKCRECGCWFDRHDGECGEVPF